jgi:hypothetical protein
MNIDVQSTHCKSFLESKIVSWKVGKMNSYLATSEKRMGSFNHAIIVIFGTTNSYPQNDDA